MLRFWYKESVFLVFKYCFYPFIKFNIEFEEGISEKDLKESQNIYALPENSISELVALHKYTSNLSIPSPIKIDLNNGLPNFICLVRPRFDPREQRIRRFLPQNLPEILNQKSETVRLIPVSFYWGIHPDKQRSFFKILFSQSWTVSSPLKKFFRVIIHGRSLVIKFHQPIYLLSQNISLALALSAPFVQPLLFPVYPLYRVTPP